MNDCGKCRAIPSHLDDRELVGSVHFGQVIFTILLTLAATSFELGAAFLVILRKNISTSFPWTAGLNFLHDRHKHFRPVGAQNWPLAELLHWAYCYWILLDRRKK